MSKRIKYFAGSLAVAALALLASAATQPRAEALTMCTKISCTNNLQCNVPACGDAGFCNSTHHCIPE